MNSPLRFLNLVTPKAAWFGLNKLAQQRVAIGFAVLASFGGLTALSAQAPQTAATPTAARAALTVTVTRVSANDWPQTLTANGAIAAWQEAIVGAEVNGLRLSEVRVNVGDSVKRGQVLAVFSDETTRAELAQLAASVAEAEANLANAKVDAERGRALEGTGALAAQQIQQYYAVEKAAVARLNATKAAQQAGQLRLNYTRVVAPDDGVISARTATVGGVVGVGQELFRLIRKGRLEWRAEVLASDLDKIKPGQAVALTTPTGSKVNGKVRSIAPTVDVTTRAAVVYVDLNASAATKAGMFASGDFTLTNAQVLSVPQQAVVVRDGFSYVMRVGPDNKVTQVKVQPGRRMQDRVEIRSGIQANDNVAATGGAFLSDGDTVRVVSASAPATNPPAAAQKP